MITHLLEIRDRNTLIPALAIWPTSQNEHQRRLLRRAGYGPGCRAPILIHLGDTEAANDPYDWASARTMRVAHAWLEEHGPDAVPDEGVLDVEYILGETASPKAPELAP